MSQPYPGAPVPYGAPMVYSAPTYRPLRRTAIVSAALMGLTAIAAVIQTVVLWSSYDNVKRFVYGLLSEDEIDRGIESIAGSGPILDLAGYLFFGTGIAFLIWLWQARENTEVLTPIQQQATISQGPYLNRSGSGPHRHAQGWVVGAWVCPIVQFWYPLEVVQDVVRASGPPQQPGLVRSGGARGLLYGWWAAWCAFWLIIVGGGGVAGISFIVWIIRLVDAADTADATGDYVDIYDLQDFMVRVALAVNIGFTVATVLLIVAGALMSLLLLRVTRWQDDRGRGIGPMLSSGSQYGPPQHGPAHPPAAPPRSFPSYGGGYQHQTPPGGTPPWPRSS